MRRTVLLAAALAAVTTPATAQEVLLRLKPPQGQVTRYHMTVDTYMKGGPMAQMATDTTQPFMHANMWQTQTITAASGEEFTMRLVVDSMRIQSPAMPQMEQMIAQMGDMMQGMATVSRMTTRGAVQSVDIELTEAMKSRMGAQGGGAMGMSGAQQGQMSGFVLMPERPVRVGSSWRDSLVVALDSAGMAGGKATFDGTFTLKRMEGRVAVIGVKGTYGTSGGSMPGGMSLAMTGEVKIDLDAGRQVAMNAEMGGDATTPMGSIPMRIVTSMTVQ